MSDAQFDLDAYVARIGYDGPRGADLPTLRGIVLAHAMAVPFENLDVLLGRGISLDPPALARKLIRERRGGYCFEQNAVLLSALRRLGFAAKGLAARVVWGRPPGFIGPRTHMLIEVELPDGPQLADVGFGGLTPTAPLALSPQVEQTTPHERFRLAAENDEWTLAAWRGGAWQNLYRFTRERPAPIDYEVANWFTATHPQSPFTNHLMMARACRDGHVTLFDDRFAIRRREGAREQHQIRDAADLAQILAAHFGIALSPADIATLAARICGRGDPDPYDRV